jgi:hypothetical protein
MIAALGHSTILAIVSRRLRSWQPGNELIEPGLKLSDGRFLTVTVIH